MAEVKIMLLHGDLELNIYKARGLPNMDMVSERLRRCFIACDLCRPTNAAKYEGSSGGNRHRDRKLDHHRKMITSDPYVTVSVPQATLVRTRVIPNSQHPTWNNHFYIPLAHPMMFLDIRVKDNDMFGAETMGKVIILAENIASGEVIEGWFPITSSSGMPPKPDTALRLKLPFVPCNKNSSYKHGIAGDPSHKGIGNTYFPVRKGSSVTLYQDSLSKDDGKMPEIMLENGLVREHAGCWECKKL